MTELTPKQVAERLQVGDVETLAAELMDDFGREALAKGLMRVEGTTVVWAAEPVELGTKV